MIATGLFPPVASFLSNSSEHLVPCQRDRLTITMLLDFSVFAQCNDRLNRGATGRCGQRVEYLLFVIGPIATYRPHRIIDLGQQGGDLRGIIDPMGRQSHLSSFSCRRLLNCDFAKLLARAESPT